MSSRKTNLIYIFIPILCLFPENLLSAKTLIYKNKYEGRETKTIIEITKAEDGYLIIKTEAEKDVHTLNTNVSFATLKWKYVNPEKNIDIVSERKGDRIIVNGIFNGDRINKTIDIDNLPWCQECNTGFVDFIKSGKGSIEFWTMDGSSMKRALKFSLDVEKKETLTINNNKCESVATWLGPRSRVIRLLWKGGRTWFRISDGMSVQAKMNFSKDPEDILLLIGEE